MEDLIGRFARLRLQTWHRVYLPGDAPQPHGVLLCVRCIDAKQELQPLFEMWIRPLAEAKGALRIEVGGGLLLDFCAKG